MRVAASILPLFLASFGVVSQTMAQSHETGLVLLDDNAYQSIPLATTPLFGDLPDSVDLADWFPTPGNQKQQASCVGWATSYLKAYQENRERSVKDYAFSPAYIYNQIKTSTDCRGGSSYVEALGLIRRDGDALLSDFPYDPGSCSARPDAGTVAKARQFAIAEWRRVNVQDSMEIKSQLASGFPVLIGMMVDDAFMALNRNSAVYPGSNTAIRGGHAMVVIGYSEKLQAFKVINSWGEHWGEDGYGWITYSAFPRFVREAYSSQDIVVQKPDTKPDQKTKPSLAATIGTLNIVHNVMVPLQNGGVAPGMQLSVDGKVTGGAGKSFQMIAKFSFGSGAPLRANPLEIFYRDLGGYVVATTETKTIGSDAEDISKLSISIPYYAMNFAWTGGMTAQNLSALVEVDVDNSEVGRSASQPFILRW
jgi:hypothetical protein